MNRLETYNESVRDLMTPKSDKDISKSFLMTINNINKPLHRYSSEQYPEYDYITTLFRTLKSDLHLLTEFDNNFISLNLYFNTIINNDKNVVYFDKINGHELNGEWECYPDKKMAYWNGHLDGQSRWVFSKDYFNNIINESVRDLMTPVPKEKFLKLVKKVPPHKRWKTVWDAFADDDDFDMLSDKELGLEEYRLKEEEKGKIADEFYDLCRKILRQERKIIQFIKKNIDAKDIRKRILELDEYDQVYKRELVQILNVLTKEELIKLIDLLKSNESVRDKMTPKSEEDIKRDLMKLSPEDKVERGTQYNNVDLIEMGVEEGGSKTVALRWACHHGKKEMVEKLLNFGVNPNTYLALSQAVVWGHIDIVRMLLEAGANPHANMDYCFIQAATKYGKDSDMLKLLNKYSKQTIEDLPVKEDIYFDEDNNIEILPEMSNIKSFDEFLFEYLDTIQKLSGIMIVVDDKILLVKPKKFKEIPEKWSIPKGKIDNNTTTIENALRELEEETGIKLSSRHIKESDKTRIFYKKSGKIKELVTYIIKLNKEELTVDMNKKWEVHKKHFDTDEVYKAKFFTKLQAIQKIEVGQMPLLKFM